MKKEQGVTYIEILIAIAIIAYVALGFTQTMLNNIKSSQASKNKTLAYNKIVNWVETNRTDYNLLTPLSYPNWSIQETGTLSDRGASYTLQTRISELILGEKGRYKKVDVKISWTERGESQEIIFSTIKAKYD
ncbi:MAG: hypothetical protein J7L42_05315 [Elusimicrobia bacterium]|nr:hypothetical protein [Elusimicrobiota bacterium]